MAPSELESGTVDIGLLAPPQMRPMVVEDVVAALTAMLHNQSGRDVTWRFHPMRDTRAPDASPHADEITLGPDESGIDDAFAKLRRFMQGRNWDVLISLTDMPLRRGRQPVIAEASGDVAVLSVPGLGAFRRGARERKALAAVVAAIVRGVADQHRVAGVGRLESANRKGCQAMTIVAPIGFGHLRVIAGMVRADRPWRLVVKLSYMLAAAVATAAITLVTSDIWVLSDALGPVRLPILTLISITILIGWLIIVHGLWEEPTRSGGREQAALFNLVTVASLGLAVLLLHVALFVITLLGGLFLIDSSVLAQELQRPIGFSAYLNLAWMSASLATVAGAVGSGLETSVDIRAAAYAYHPEREQQSEPKD